jgi:hypothetical protein
MIMDMRSQDLSTAKNVPFTDKHKFTTVNIQRLKYKNYDPPAYHNSLDRAADESKVEYLMKTDHWFALLWYTMLIRVHNTENGQVSLTYMTLYNEDDEYPVAVGHYCFWMVIMQHLYPGLVRGSRTFKRDTCKSGYINTLKPYIMKLYSEDLVSIRHFTGSKCLSVCTPSRIEEEEQFVVSAYFIRHVVTALRNAYSKCFVTQQQQPNYMEFIKTWCTPKDFQGANPSPFLQPENYKDFTARELSSHNVVHTIHSLRLKAGPEMNGKTWAKSKRFLTPLFGVPYWKAIQGNMTQALHFFGTYNFSYGPYVHCKNVLTILPDQKARDLTTYSNKKLTPPLDIEKAPKLDGNNAYLRYRQQVRAYFQRNNLPVKEKGRPRSSQQHLVALSNHLMKLFKKKVYNVDDHPDTRRLLLIAQESERKLLQAMRSSNPHLYETLQYILKRCG